MSASILKRRSRCLMFTAAGLLCLGVGRPVLADTIPDPITAFQSLVNSASVTGPGYYTSATRGVFAAGSLDIRVPSGAVHLITISPPTFSAGCGGISSFFGSFSFLSGPQIEQLVENILKNAVGYAIHIAIRTLCPMCADILGQLQALAQKLASGAIDSCSVAKNLVNSGAKMAGFGSVSSDGDTGWCSQVAVDKNAETDYGAARNDICGTISKASGWLDNSLKATASAVDTATGWMDGGGASDATKSAASIGNTSWKTLTLAGYSNTWVKEIIMSISGATMVQAPQPGDNDQSEKHRYAGFGPSPEVNATKMLYLLMYGADPASDLTALSKAGQTVSTDVEQQIEFAKGLDLGNMPFIWCTGWVGDKEGDGVVPAVENSPYGKMTGKIPNLLMCDHPDPKYSTVKSVIGKNPLITSNGLIVSVANSLTSAVYAIQSGKPIPVQALQLMQIVPLPLYRMVNIAAVFPDTASQLVGVYSQFVAVLIAQNIITSWIQHPDAPVSGATTTAALQAVNASLAKVIAEISTAVKKNAKDMATTLTIQDSLLATLAQVNNVIYQSLGSTGLQGNLGFSQGLAAGMVQGH